MVNKASIISPSSAFTRTYNGSGNYRDEGLGSVKRKEEVMERAKMRKQNSIVERARMKQELLKLEEMKRQRRFKVRELKRRQKVRETAAAVTVQRVYRGYSLRTHLAIEKFLRQTFAVNSIIRSYRTYCLVRVAKADRGVMDKIRKQDAAARMLQQRVTMWKLRKNAVALARQLRIKREAERLEFIRLLREKAACYIQRIFRGIGGRNRVVKMAVEQQVQQAQNRIDNEEEEEKKDQIMAVKKRNRYASLIKKH
jgi:hypothetical protein